MNPAARAWAETLAWLLLAWTALGLLLHPAAISMAEVWNSSDTYAHGYVILPISLWLAWRRWPHLARLEAGPDYRVLWLVPALGVFWLLGQVTLSQLAEHYAVTGLLILAIWGVTGRRIAWALFFPLAYLLFMVPSGDALIDPLIDFTADTAVAAVRLFGIPVYRENNFFSLPSGDWSVVEACSGMRYFLSSLALGWLYAYLTYRTWWKRLAFGVAAIIVPILTNGIRAALIVLLGHYSNMTLAVGVDHLIYGWIWFGIVMMAMFWIGNLWREDHLTPDAPPVGPVQTPRSPALLVTALVLLTALFPLYEQHLRARADAPSPLARYTPPAPWRAAPAPVTHWTPVWYGVSDERALHLEDGQGRLLVHLMWYGAQRQGRELVNAYNQVALEKNQSWRKVREHTRTVRAAGTELTLRESVLEHRKNAKRVLIWHWWRVQGEDSVDALRTKARLAASRIAGRGDAAAVAILAAPYEIAPAEAEAVFLRYLNASRADLNRSLDGEQRAAP